MPYKDPIVRKQFLRKWQKEFGLTFSRSRRLRHQKVLDRIKLEVGCEHCGYNEHPKALEFHHVNPKNKSFTISKSLSRKLIYLLKETEKCMVLCSNCHRIEEHRLNDNSLY